ncbi:unnamed protein product, partial [Tilletia controversa]
MPLPDESNSAKVSSLIQRFQQQAEQSRQQAQEERQSQKNLSVNARTSLDGGSRPSSIDLHRPSLSPSALADMSSPAPVFPVPVPVPVSVPATDPAPAQEETEVPAPSALPEQSLPQEHEQPAEADASDATPSAETI